MSCSRLALAFSNAELEPPSKAPLGGSVTALLSRLVRLPLQALANNSELISFRSGATSEIVLRWGMVADRVFITIRAPLPQCPTHTGAVL